MFELDKHAEVEDISIVPDQFRPYYTTDPVDGRHVLRMDDPIVKSSVETISGLHKALSSERTARKTDRSKIVDLSSLSEFGSTPDEIKQGITAKIDDLTQQLADASKGGARINVEKIKQELSKAYEQEAAAKDSANSALRAQLDSVIIDNEARRALDGKTDEPELVLPFIMQQVKPVEEEGHRQVFVVDAQGDRRFNPATGHPMSIGDLVEEMKKTPKFKRLFNSEAPAGMPNPRGAARPVPRSDSSAASTPVSKIATGLAALRQQRGGFI